MKPNLVFLSRNEFNYSVRPVCYVVSNYTKQKVVYLETTIAQLISTSKLVNKRKPLLFENFHVMSPGYTVWDLDP